MWLLVRNGAIQILGLIDWYITVDKCAITVYNILINSEHDLLDITTMSWYHWLKVGEVTFGVDYGLSCHGVRHLGQLNIHQCVPGLTNFLHVNIPSGSVKPWGSIPREGSLYGVLSGRHSFGQDGVRDWGKPTVENGGVLLHTLNAVLNPCLQRPPILKDHTFVAEKSTYIF